MLLIQPPQGTQFGLTNILRIEPLGLECVGGALEGEDHEVRIVDMRLDGWAALRQEYEAFGPDAVGVACQFMTDVYTCLHAGGFLCALDPEAFLFAGGHHATLRPDDLLFGGSPFDALVSGEGELTSVELVAALRDGRPAGEVPGVMTPENRHDGFMARPMVRNLDEVVLPARHLTDRYRRKYHQGDWAPSAAVETSRGCPFDCNFCSVWVFYARRARRFTPDRIMADLARVGEPHVFFTDDIAFIHRPSYEELGRRIQAVGSFRNFSAETRADLVVKHQDMFDLWRSVGMRTIFLGIEKIDDEGLEAVRKRTDAEKNRLAIRILQDKGIRPMTSLIVDPRWTEEDFDRLEAYLEAMELDQPVFTILTPLPGTELWEECRDRLVTDNYLQYDVMHAVLPTRLPLERFYERYARLFRYTTRHRRAWMSALNFVRLAAKGSAFVLPRFYRAFRQMRDPEAYLEDPVESPPAGVEPFGPSLRFA